MTTGDLSNPESFYELFLLQELQQGEADDGEYRPRVRPNPRRTKGEILCWIYTVMHREISWERGLTDDQLIDRKGTLEDWGFKTTQERVEGSDPPRLHLLNKDERDYIRSDKAAIDRLQHECLFAGYSIQVGGFNEHGEWRWFRPEIKRAVVPGALESSNSYAPRHGRKVLLALPQLDLDEHQALSHQIQVVWTLLLDARQSFKSNEHAYKAIKGAITEFKELIAIMADEVCDLTDVPEGSETLWAGIEPTSPKRVKKAGLEHKYHRLNYETHVTLADAIGALWKTLVALRKRYTQPADLQKLRMRNAIEGMAEVCRRMSQDVDEDVYESGIRR